jgi:RND family efflux transporter MFP subunit
MKRGATAEDLTRASAQVTSAENGVKAAEASLATAEANNKQVVEGATAEERRIAEAAVVQASEALKLAANPYRASDYEQARAGVLQAEAALEGAEIGLAEAAILSPVDGVISERAQSVGQLVGPSSPIVTIVSSEVELALGVEEAQIGSISEGQKAEVTVAAYPGEVFPARVALISPTADAKSRTFTVKVRPDIADGRLRSGMFASVRILTAEKAGAVLLPREALVTKAGSTSVFVVSGETVSQRAVKTGIASGNQVEILSGVSAGDEVVVAGGAELRDGDRVKKG